MTTKLLTRRADEIDGGKKSDSVSGYVKRAETLENNGEFRKAGSMYWIAAEHADNFNLRQKLIKLSQNCFATIN